ncbi:MAG: DUF4347 domain-containing protein, partial [Magnetococcales bacterium]|nr:DUF4347 domain-containing protein [Magnetococcales bacterium]
MATTQKSDHRSPNPLRHHKHKPIIMALEPRIMFDGAGVETVAEAPVDPALPDQTILDAHPAIAEIPAPVVVRECNQEKNNGRKEVALIDTNVADYQILVDGVREGVEVVLIDGSRSGLDQLAQWAETHSGYDAIHILSHGSEGTLFLGKDIVNRASLSDVRVNTELAVLGDALSAEGDLLVYGCDISAGAAGPSFLANLAAITGVDVAASGNTTGAADKGGDWSLEKNVGTIDVNSLTFPEFPGILATITISGADTGGLGTDGFSVASFSKTVAADIGNATLNFTCTGDYIAYQELSGVATNTMFGVYGLNSDYSKYELFIATTGYTFDLTGFNYAVDPASDLSITLKVAYAADPSSYSDAANLTLLQGNKTTGRTLSGITQVNDVVGVQFFSNFDSGGNFYNLQDFIITDVRKIVAPSLTSATYDASSNQLVVTGVDLTTGNAIDETKLTLTGQGGATHTLTETGAITAASTTSFTITLNATDQINVEGLLNKAGTSSVGGTTYDLAGAADWHGTGNADLTGNAVTVSNVQTPTVSSATYDASTGVLAVTGTHLVKASGVTNDITVSKLTLTGEGGTTRVLTTSDVELTDGTHFSVTLNAADQAALHQIFNKTGTASTGGTTYNIAAADDWNTVITHGDIADATNGVTVSNPTTPTLTSATYDASTGVLAVTGTGFLKLSGATNDIDITKLTLAGEGGTTRTLTTSNVEITDGTSFTVTLNAADQAVVNTLLNKAGTSATGGATYNLAAAEDWAAGAEAGVNVADLTGNGITVSSPTTPAITSTAYDATAGTLTLTGTGFLSLSGATNDLVANKFTFTGEGGETHTLTDTANIEITSGTTATLTLSATDKAAVNPIMNKAGTTSTSGTTYNVAAAEDWAAGAEAGVNVVDATTGVTVSNVPTPTVTSATYDYASNTLVVTGTGLLKKSGATNDIDLTKLTLTGEGGATHTLAATSNVELTSGTQFSVVLSGADIYNVEALLNKDGTASVSATTYNLAAAEDWAAGADSAVVVADTTGNGITVSNYAAPTVTSATYDWSNGQLVLTGTNFVNKSGATNDVVATLFTITGEGGTYTLTDTASVEVTSA